MKKSFVFFLVILCFGCSENVIEVKEERVENEEQTTAELRADYKPAIVVKKVSSSMTTASYGDVLQVSFVIMNQGQIPSYPRFISTRLVEKMYFHTSKDRWEWTKNNNKTILLRKDYLGCIYPPATDEYRTGLSSPIPYDIPKGEWYLVVEIEYNPQFPLDKDANDPNPILSIPIIVTIV